MDELTFNNLHVWHRGMEFAEKVMDVSEEIQGHYKLIEQIESGAVSVPQNMAEVSEEYPQKSSYILCKLTGNLFMKLIHY